jgi:hypothetical protein
MTSFANWLAAMLKEPELQVDRVLRDETALHFLIAWSLFESKCFKNELFAGRLRAFAERLPREGFAVEYLSGPLAHFHERYQVRQRLDNLLHHDKTSQEVLDHFKRCLESPASALTATDQIFFVAFVVYRFRNNMFHGNKGVRSWLQFRPQVQLCTFAMQQFVAHDESHSPSMVLGAAA